MGGIMYCTFCGSKNVSQLTKVIVIMQLPGAAIDTIAFGCGDCGKRWFVESTSSSHQADPADVVNICPNCGRPMGNPVFCVFCEEEKAKRR